MKETTLQIIAKTMFRHPFCTTFALGVLLSFIAWIWLLHPVSELQTDNYVVGTVLFICILWIIGGVFGYTFQDSFITDTRSCLDHYRYKNILLKVRDGKVVAVGDCFWGTSGIYEISTEKYPFQVNTSIVCKVNPYCNVTIPVTLSIESIEKTGSNDRIKLRPYDYQELYERVIMGAGVNSVADFVKKLIEKSIGENQQTFDGYARGYTGQKISSTILLQVLVNFLSFPDNALSNFDGFKICLDAPVVSTCKGSSKDSSCHS